MSVRRVVTGHGPGGASVLIEDSRVDPPPRSLVPGSESHLIWADDDTATVPADGLPQPGPAYFPPVNGVRFKVITFWPDQAGTTEAATTEAAVARGNDPSMHVSDTVDYAYVAAGAITLELDGGAEIELRAGDTVVQRGTRHAWRNRGRQPCVIVSTLVGAVRIAQHSDDAASSSR